MGYDHDDAEGTDCPCAVCVRLAYEHNVAMAEEDET